MNISSVSFFGLKNPNYKSGNNIQMHRTNRGASDEYIRSSKKKPVSKKKKSLIPNGLKTFAAGSALTLLLANGLKDKPNMPANVTIPFDSSTTSISEIAEIYDTNESFIMLYNDIDNTSDLSEISELKIPSSYDYIQDEIDKLQDDLFSSKLSAEKREELENKVSGLKEKQELQQNAARVYSDGKYVYFIVNITDNFPEELSDKYKFGINVETFKDLFDIKDKAIRRNNDIDFSWERYEDAPEMGAYKDYTGTRLHSGDVIKVPVSAIKTNDINLGDSDSD